MNKLEKGMKFATEGKLLKYVDLDSTNTNQKKKNLEWLKQFVTYEKTGKMSKGNVTNEIIITEVSNIPEKEDGRKNNGGQNKGTSKYGDVVIPTILYLLKETEGHEIIDYSSRILEKIGAVSYEFIRFEAEDSYSNNFYASTRNDIKESFLNSPCNSAQTLGYIKYDREHIVCQIEEGGVWTKITKKDKKIFNRYSKEVLKALGCKTFEDLNKKSFKDRSIKKRFNGMLLEKLHKDERLQWYDYRWYTRITLVDAKGKDMDMRKEVNDKVLEYVENRIEGHKEKNNEKEDRNGLNKEKPKKFNIEKEEKIKQLIEDKSLESVDPKEYKANKKRKAYEKTREEDQKVKFDKEVELARATTKQAKRNANSLQINKRFTPVEECNLFKEVDEFLTVDEENEEY